MNPAKPKRRYFPRFSLRTLLLATMLIAAVWSFLESPEPWKRQYTLTEAKGSERAMHITDAGLSPDGKRLLACSASEVKLWDVTSGVCIQRLALPEKNRQDYVHQARFSGSGRWVVGIDSTKKVHVWDTQTGHLTRTLPYGNTEELAGGMGAPIRMETVRVMPFRMYMNPHDDSMVTLDTDGQLRLWSLPDGEVKLEGELFGGFLAVHFDNKGVVLLYAGGSSQKPGEPRSLQLWRLGEKNPTLTLPVQGGSVSQGYLSPDGSRTFAMDRNSVFAWNLDTGTQIGIFEDNRFKMITFPFRGLLVSPPLDRVLVLADATVGGSSNVEALVLNAHTMELVSRCRDPEDTLEWATFSPSGDRVLGYTLNWKLHLWDAETGDLLRTFDPEVGIAFDAERPPFDVGFSPKGDRIFHTQGYVNGLRVYRRSRPEFWYGIAWLWETWAVLIFGIGLTWTVVKDWKRLQMKQEDQPVEASAEPT